MYRIRFLAMLHVMVLLASVVTQQTEHFQAEPLPTNPPIVFEENEPVFDVFPNFPEIGDLFGGMWVNTDNAPDDAFDFGPPAFILDLLSMIPDIGGDAEFVMVETITEPDGTTTERTTTNLRRGG
jgi:hypothetical protein